MFRGKVYLAHLSNVCYKEQKTKHSMYISVYPVSSTYVYVWRSIILYDHIENLVYVSYVCRENFEKFLQHLVVNGKTWPWM